MPMDTKIVVALRDEYKVSSFESWKFQLEHHKLDVQLPPLKYDWEKGNWLVLFSVEHLQYHIIQKDLRICNWNHIFRRQHKMLKQYRLPRPFFISMNKQWQQRYLQQRK